MIEIKDQIFMGNGEYSMALVGHVYSELAYAFDTLNRMQQPPRPIDHEESHKEHVEYIKDAETELDRIAKEIYLALTGKTPINQENANDG